MSREEYVCGYLPAEYQRMALHLLPEGERSLNEWRNLWQRTLNSPAR